MHQKTGIEATPDAHAGRWFVGSKAILTLSRIPCCPDGMGSPDPAQVPGVSRERHSYGELVTIVQLCGKLAVCNRDDSKNKKEK